MKNTWPQRDFGFFSARLEKEILHIKFKKNLLNHLTNLDKRDMVTEFADQVLKTRDIKVIL